MRPRLTRSKVPNLKEVCHEQIHRICGSDRFCRFSGMAEDNGQKCERFAKTIVKES